MAAPSLPSHVDHLIVGSGFAGLCAAIKLAGAGETDYVVIEKADDVGGTWRDNTYPGCACDVPSVLYSFSFAPNPSWSRSFSPQPEIWDYLEDCVHRFNLKPFLRLGVEVESAAWDDQAQLCGDRRPVRATDPGPARPGDVRRHGLPLRALAARPRPDRPRRSGRRDRRQRYPVRATDRPEGPPPGRVPAQRAVDHPAG